MKNLVIFIFMIYMAHVSAICSNSTCVHGYCGIKHPLFGYDFGHSRCICYDKYKGVTCNQIKCPEGPTWFDSEKLYANRTQEECSGIGKCVEGVCECPNGFSGPSCGVLNCPVNSKNKVCSNHGICVKISQGNDYSNWDKDSTYGCKCDEGYKGSDCSIRTCVENLDPMRVYLPSRQIYKHSEFNTLRSLTNTEYIYIFSANGKKYNVYLTDDAEMQKKNIAEAMVKFGFAALADDVVVDVYGSATEVPSVNPSIPTKENDDDYKIPSARRILADTGNYLDIIIKKPLKQIPIIKIVNSEGKKYLPSHKQYWRQTDAQPTECSSRGTCDSGSCKCDPGFSSSTGYPEHASGNVNDCGYKIDKYIYDDDGKDNTPGCPYIDSPSSLNGKALCSDRGTCVEDELYCICNERSTGHNCSEYVCPKGLAWFDQVDINTGEAHKLAECSNRGVCNRAIGDCNCFDGFSGSACQNNKCPSATGAVCSGHGKCLTLREYKNREGIEAKDGWELDSVSRCVCYKGYSGDDCSTPYCPYGPDPYELKTMKVGNDNMYNNSGADGAAVGFRFKCKTLDKKTPSSDQWFELSLNEKVVPLHAAMTESEVAEAIKKSRAIRVKNAYTKTDRITLKDAGSYDLFVAFGTPSTTTPSPSTATPPPSLKVCSTDGTIVDIRFPAFYCKEDLLITMDFNPAELQISNRKKGYFKSNTGTDNTFTGFKENVDKDNKDSNNKDEPEELAINLRKRCYECSNNGICDTSRKGCRCFGGYRSSNGIGGSGTKGDCGHDDITANIK